MERKSRLIAPATRSGVHSEAPEVVRLPTSRPFATGVEAAGLLPATNLGGEPFAKACLGVLVGNHAFRGRTFQPAIQFFEDI